MEGPGFEQSVEGLLSQLLLSVEEDPDFDVEGFLAECGDQAHECRVRIEKLKAAGLLNVAKPEAGGLLAGRYHLLGLVGRGGMGRVDRAADLQLGRPVAIKRMYSSEERVVLPEHASVLRERFLREAKTTGLLEHPSIVPVHELGETETGDPFLVMKLIEGRTLSELIESWKQGEAGADPDPVRTRVEWVLRICDALRFAHSRGVVHRDLKPANVMVGAFGELQVMDWGLAKVVNESDAELAGALGSGSPDLSASGEIFGTPNYLSPEQAEGRLAEIDERTDVFGICAILFSLLALDTPYGSGDSKAVLARAARAEVGFDVLDQRVVPRELVAILRRGMSARASDRYPSVEALRQDCESWLTDREGQAWRDGPWSRTIKWVRRHPAAAALGTAAVVVLAMGLFTGREVNAARRERATAEVAARNVSIEESLKELSARELYRLSAEDATVLWREQESRVRGGASLNVALPQPEVVPRYEYEAMAHDVVEQLDDSPIAVLSGPEEFWFELLQEEGGLEADFRPRVFDVLYFLAYCMHGAGLTELFEYEAGTSSWRPTEARLEEWKDGRVRHAALLDNWGRVVRLVGAESDPHVRRVWASFLEGVRNGSDTLREELDAGVFDQEPRALMLATRFLDARADDDEMMERWKRVLEKKPDAFPALLALLSALAAEKNWEEARVWGEAAKALVPESPWAWSELAFVYVGLGELELAERYARHTAGLAPDPITLRRTALVLFRIDQADPAERPELLEDAIAFERGALAFRPATRWLDSNLALFLQRAGKFDDLLKYARQAREQFPDAPEAIVAEAKALQELGNNHERDLAYLRGTERLPDVALFWAELGKVAAFRDHFEHAVPYLREAVRLIVGEDSQVDRYALDQLPYDPAEELGKAEWRLATYLSGTVPDDLREIVWHADTAGFRGEYHRAVELYRRLFAAWEESLDPVAWYEATGFDPFGFYRMALRWIVPAMNGEGYLFVEGRPVTFHDGFLSVDSNDGYGEPMPMSERPTLSSAPFYTESYRADLRALFAESLVWLIECLRMDQALANPTLGPGGVRVFVADVLAEIPVDLLSDDELFILEELQELAR